MTNKQTHTPDWPDFDAAYKKACESSQPSDWMQAALLAQQVRHAAPVTKQERDELRAALEYLLNPICEPTCKESPTDRARALLARISHD